MKIAVYILDAMISGTTTFAFELARGLEAARHDVTTLSSTKSGKETVRWSRPDGGAQWWRHPPQLTVRHDELADVFDSFDLVITNDIASSTLDGKGVPAYVDALLRTKTPWTTIAHGNKYDKKHARHFPLLLENSPSMLRAFFACPAPYDYAEHELFKDLQRIHLPRPYTPALPVDSDVQFFHCAGTVGRFSTGKNLHATALALPYFDMPINLELWGACINSIRPTDAYLTFEELEKRPGITVIRTPELKNRTSPWAVQTDNKHMLWYNGEYVDPIMTLSRLRVFANMTSPSFSAGTEYTTMEAVDAGCLILAQDAMIDSGSEFSFGTLGTLEFPASPAKAAQMSEALHSIATRITVALDTSAKSHDETAQHNREVLRREHNPQMIAEQFIDTLAGLW